ncbi:MAG: leucine-rich repeat domain-containing protein [Spirochaetaceae bacterium]|nr:leucine-rich repeat domain-containing protein [Spirochaetaceae bacterium]
MASINIPSSVTTIGDYAFYQCENLTSVTLSRRTKIGEGAFPASARITYRD